MSWADRAKDALRRGETVIVRPRGHSMRPKVNDGQRVQIGNNRGQGNGWVGPAAISDVP